MIKKKSKALHTFSTGLLNISDERGCLRVGAQCWVDFIKPIDDNDWGGVLQAIIAPRPC